MRQDVFLAFYVQLVNIAMLNTYLFAFKQQLILPTYLYLFLPYICSTGAFLADRAMRLRVVFGENRLTIKNLYDAKTGNKLSENEMTERENYVLSGADGWKYEHFINWEFFPSVYMPVLVYFKEDQTTPAKWNVGPGAYDWRNNGMVHFFPAFGNSFQIKREFEKRNLSKVDSKKNKGM